MAKNGYVNEGGKVERSNATPTKLLSDYSYNIWNPCYSNLLMISSLTLKYQGNTTKGPLYCENWHFIAIPSICNQRSLHYIIKRTFLLPLLYSTCKNISKKKRSSLIAISYLSCPMDVICFTIQGTKISLQKTSKIFKFNSSN